MYIQGDSNKVLQRVFSFIIGYNFFLLFTNKITSFEVFNRVPCTVGMEVEISTNRSRRFYSMIGEVTY